jgi:hypothetical protein
MVRVLARVAARRRQGRGPTSAAPVVTLVFTTEVREAAGGIDAEARPVVWVNPAYWSTLSPAEQGFVHLRETGRHMLGYVWQAVLAGGPARARERRRIELACTRYAAERMLLAGQSRALAQIANLLEIEAGRTPDNAAAREQAELVWAVHARAAEIEMEAFLATLDRVGELGRRGRTAAGFQVLVAGLSRAKAAQEAGEPWGDLMARRWHQALERYAQRYQGARA